MRRRRDTDEVIPSPSGVLNINLHKGEEVERADPKRPNLLEWWAKAGQSLDAVREPGSPQIVDFSESDPRTKQTIAETIDREFRESPDVIRR